MTYIIDAGVQEGKPQLRIIDPRTGALRLQWRLDASDADGSVQQLFRQLFLLSCGNRPLVDGAECTRCNACIDEPAAVIKERRRVARTG